MNCSTRLSGLFRLTLLAFSLSLPTVAAADSVDELSALVNEGNATAWEMAERMEPENAGDPDFDFWYGLAAKAAGKKQQAVFAFERVVLNQPENGRAKLELADAHAQFGNHGEARRLFDEVLATTPPEPVQQRIRTYLAAIEAAGAKKGTQVSSFVTVALGHDSNINNATSEVQHDIGALTFILAPSSLETDAMFMDLRAGVDIVTPVSQRHLRFLSLSAQARDNEDVFSGGNYDYAQASMTGGWMFRSGAATWRVPVNLQALTVESDESRYLGTLGVEYTRPLSSTRSLVLFGQAGQMHFPSQDIRNAYLALAGAGYVINAPSSPWRLTLTAHAGTEPAEEDAGKFNGRDYIACRINARYALDASHSLYGALGVQSSQYKDTHPVLLMEREEMLVDASAGWQWQLDRQWNVNLDVSHADNASKGNALYDYDRTQVMLGSTWRF